MSRGKDDRIECRVDHVTKDRLARAAELSNQSLSEFLLRSATDAADAVLRDADLIRLTRRDSERFLAALLGEAKPNEALQAAAEAYQGELASGRLESR
jgi:uncharacterized protein (DUF1778 family)